jgi:2-phospho-L-lactate guanylyltransferase
MSSTSPHPDATITALVPLRTGGKSRLQDAVDGTRRDALVLAMLDDVLAALHAAGILDVQLLCGDAGAATAAATRGLVAVLDPTDAPADRPGGASATAASELSLRRAVDTGLARVGTGAVRLVVAADLPLLDHTELASLLASTADVALAPTRGGGTAVLRLGPGVVLPTQYGAASAEAHLRIARERGLSVDVLDLPGAQHDVDGVADLESLTLALVGDGTLANGRGGGRATASFLAEHRG